MWGHFGAAGKGRNRIITILLKNALCYRTMIEVSSSLIDIMSRLLGIRQKEEMDEARQRFY